MKRIVSLALVCVMLLCSVFTLASCGKTVSGTYEAEINVVLAKYTVTYEFKGNDVTVTSQLSSSIGSLNPTVITGTYKLDEDEDGNTTITFDYTDDKDAEGAEKEGVAVPFAQGEEEGVKYIKIGGVKFTEVKD